MSSFNDGILQYTIIAGSNVSVFKINTTIVTANIPATVLNNGTTYNVTSIAASAFLNCTSLTSVTIPNSVTSIGTSAFQGCNKLTSITIPNLVTGIGTNTFRACTGLTSIIIPSSVTIIGESAFQNCTSLTSVTFDSSSNLTSIGANAFQGCTSLTSVTIPNSVTSISNSTFSGCTGLTSITIPASVTSIGTSAFSGCTGLTSITIPALVTSIGSFAFQNCAGLTSIIIPTLVTSIGTSAFSGCTGLTSITIPASVTSIGTSAFSGCTGLTSITIPASVTSIGTSAFSGCTGLTSITIPDLVTSIGDSAFSGCTGLTSITIPNLVTGIGTNAFYNCTGLTSVTIPNSVTTIGINAFQGCNKLTSITIPSSVTSIGQSAFQGCTGLTSVTFDPSSNLTTIGVNTFRACTSLTSITIPALVTSIGANAFYGCTSLTSITIPNLVTSIGANAFQGCNSLTSIIIPNLVTSIGANTFNGCNKLNSIIIPASVTSIGDYAFQNCAGLTSIIIPALVTSIGATAFYGCTSLTSIIIPNLVTSIGANTFNGCNKLTSITIPALVTSISASAFFGCTSLTSITVDISNPNYSSDELGVLFNKTKTTLIQFPLGLSGSYTIPTSVTIIGANEFQNCNKLTSVTIPASVTSIGNNAFIGCTGLTSVYFLGNIPTIGASNFTIINDTAYYYQGSTNILSLSMFTNVLPITTPTFGINDTISKTYGSNFKLDPSSNSLGAFSFTSSDLAVATIDASGNVTPVSIGTCTIIINQQPNRNFLSATKSVTLNISTTSIAPTLTWLDISQNFADVSFTLVAPSSNSTGAFTYSSSNLLVASISGNIVTIVGAGSTTITATQDETTNYTSGNTSVTVNVEKAQPIITTTIPSNLAFGDTFFNLNASSINTDISFNYAIADISGNIDVVTIDSSGNVTLIGGGWTKITIIQYETQNYKSAEAIVILFVNPDDVTITAETEFINTYGNIPFKINAISSNKDTLFRYDISGNANVVTVDPSGNVTIIGAGTTKILISQDGTEDYFPANIAIVDIHINPATPTLTWLDISQNFADVSFTLVAPSSNSTGAFTYSSSNTSIVDIYENVVTINGAGTATITATQAATTNYDSKTIDITVNVAKATPTLTWYNTDLQKTYGDSFTLVDPSSNSSGAFTYSSSNTSIVDICGNIVTINGAGSTTITATQAASSNYTSGNTTISVNVAKATPNLTWYNTNLQNTYGDSSFNLVVPSSNSSGAFTYSSSNTSIVDICGNIVTIVGAGTATITATQDASSNYISGNTSVTVNVAKAQPTISTIISSTLTFGTDTSFNLNASSINKDTFIYDISSNTDNAISSIDSSGKVTIIGGGNATITITQLETANYLSAKATVNIVVNRDDVTITINPANSLLTYTYNDSPFNLNASSINNDKPFKYDISGNANVVTVDPSGNVTIVGAGTTKIFISQEGTEDYLAANIAIVDININPATPTLTWTDISQNFADVSFTLVAPSSNSTGAFTYSSSNLLVASISGNIVTIVGAGSTTITAHQDSSENYLAKDISNNLVINKAQPTITWYPNDIIADFSTNNLLLADPSSNSSGAFNFSSNNDNVDISGNLVIFRKLGKCEITATQVETGNYTSKSTTINFYVKTIPTITGIPTTITKIYETNNFKLDPSSNSSGAFTYDISGNNTNVATVDGSGNVILVGIGNTEITISQQETDMYFESSIDMNLISNVCFPAKTPIVTNQGIIHIDKINPAIHTIRNKKIVAITKTVSQDKYLICFEKDALGTNMPSQKTIITQNHEILYKGRMTKAKDFLQNFENVKKVKYSGEVLYNVLMEEHNKMVVNNLICETLHPENGVAKLQMVLQNLNSDDKQRLIEEYNNYVIKNNVYSSKKITK